MQLLEFYTKQEILQSGRQLLEKYINLDQIGLKEVKIKLF